MCTSELNESLLPSDFRTPNLTHIYSLPYATLIYSLSQYHRLYQPNDICRRAQYKAHNYALFSSLLFVLK